MMTFTLIDKNAEDAELMFQKHTVKPARKKLRWVLKYLLTDRFVWHVRMVLIIMHQYHGT